MSFPYYIFLIVYGLGILFCVGFFAINLFHLTRFGLLDFTARVHTVLMISVIVIVLVFTGIFLRDVDWLETVELAPNLSVDGLPGAL